MVCDFVIFRCCPWVVCMCLLCVSVCVCVCVGGWVSVWVCECACVSAAFRHAFVHECGFELHHGVRQGGIAPSVVGQASQITPHVYLIFLGSGRSRF
jgi:hypothetical protein